jgi:hypothetical protein
VTITALIIAFIILILLFFNFIFLPFKYEILKIALYPE